MKKIKEKIEFKYFLLKLKLREFKFKLLGIDRNFYCQSDIEGQRMCKFQCDHCEEYYRPLKNNLKK